MVNADILNPTALVLPKKPIGTIAGISANAESGTLFFATDDNQLTFVDNANSYESTYTAPTKAAISRYFSMDDNAASTAVVDSKAVANGVYSGGNTNAKTGAGVVSTALTFDGANDYIEVADHASLNFGTGDFSFSLWFKFDATAQTVNFPRLIGKSTADVAAAVPGFEIYTRKSTQSYPGAICFKMGDGTYASTSSVLFGTGSNYGDNAWHHLVITVDRSEGRARGYVDGLYVGQTTVSTVVGNVDNAAVMRFGMEAYGTGYDFLGSLDEVSIYKGTALTAGQVAWIYNGGSGRAYADYA
jgi:hypothetical protein